VAARKLVCALLAVPLATTFLAGPVGAQFSQDSDAFPGPGEVRDRLEDFDEHAWIEVTQVGTSNEDRPISVAEVADPNATTPRDERAVTLILTQQHGNEPAGTPAALRLLENVTAGGEVTERLDDQILVVMPMVNPDGAEAFQRGNADGIDVNRDHIALETPEAQAVHHVINEWDVDVALDHHEYGGTGLGNPIPIRTYDYDLLTLFPVHGNVKAPTLDVARELMYDGIWPRVQEEGYAVNEYGEVTVNGEPVQTIAGGPDPGILRNHYGLHNVAGLLIETRVDAHPNPFHTPERRIQIQSTVMDAAVRYVDEHADRFTDAREASEELAVEVPADEYVEGDTTGDLAKAYELPDDEELLTAMDRHNITVGQATEEGLVHDAVHPLRGHAAALFHPDSSRTIAEASATELPEDGGQAADLEEASADEGANGVPFGVGTALAALLAAFALAGRTRLR
jgi:hypothetical protein